MSQLLEPLTYTPEGPIFDQNGVRMDDPSKTVNDEDRLSDFSPQESPAASAAATVYYASPRLATQEVGQESLPRKEKEPSPSTPQRRAFFPTEPGSGVPVAMYHTLDPFQPGKQVQSPAQQLQASADMVKYAAKAAFVDLHVDMPSERHTFDEMFGDTHCVDARSAQTGLGLTPEEVDLKMEELDETGDKDQYYDIAKELCDDHMLDPVKLEPAPSTVSVGGDLSSSAASKGTHKDMLTDSQASGSQDASAVGSAMEDESSSGVPSSLGIQPPISLGLPERRNMELSRLPAFVGRHKAVLKELREINICHTGMDYMVFRAIHTGCQIEAVEKNPLLARTKHPECGGFVEATFQHSITGLYGCMYVYIYIYTYIYTYIYIYIYIYIRW
jgi:hypothetical protein